MLIQASAGFGMLYRLGLTKAALLSALIGRAGAPVRWIGGGRRVPGRASSPALTNHHPHRCLSRSTFWAVARQAST